MNRLSQPYIALAIISLANFAVAASPNTPIHGPESNAPLNMSRCLSVRLQPGERVRFDFYCSAYYENEAIIYDDLGNRMVSKGNYGLGLGSWSWRNNSSRPRTLIISSWHKRGPYPSGSLPWRQSPKRVFQGGANGAVGFEDSVDNSYNDVVVRYRIYN